jgi:hypothetical protein
MDQCGKKAILIPIYYSFRGSVTLLSYIDYIKHIGGEVI